jgi:alkylhydroperoxidase family enzyme
VFTFDEFAHSVPDVISAAQSAAWQSVAGAGSWWSGQQRVTIARELRAARMQRSEASPSPKPSPSVSDLPAAAVEATRRIATDAHRLDRTWCDGITHEFGDAAYVELVAISVFTTVVDVFAEALGTKLEPLPRPQVGDPDKQRPTGLGDAGAWVPMTVPWRGPNVARALSLAPNEQRGFMGLVGSMYAVADFTELVWDRPLSRPQVELVAARVSAVNECFY